MGTNLSVSQRNWAEQMHLFLSSCGKNDSPWNQKQALSAKPGAKKTRIFTERRKQEVIAGTSVTLGPTQPGGQTMIFREPVSRFISALEQLQILDPPLNTSPFITNGE